MGKVFNTTAVCIPRLHYMVDITRRLEEIKKMVEDGKYFVINRGRQYGKTTMLMCLRSYLKPKYQVVGLDFQSLGSASYQDESTFAKAFATIFCDAFLRQKDDEESGVVKEVIALEKDVEENKNISLLYLFRRLRKICGISDCPLVLTIDEVDSASDNQVFLDFLAQLRNDYINREEVCAFQSVILAGVTDVRHLRGKIRSEEEHKVNSPWNIAADFKVQMEFNAEDIQSMLKEYEADHHTGMDMKAVAGYIEEYTGGYPFLVSRICQIVDENLMGKVFTTQKEAWTKAGVEEAVKEILAEDNTLFESLTGKLENYPELKRALYGILMSGREILYNADKEELKLLSMYGFIRNKEGLIEVSNRIFEMRLYNLFLADEAMKSDRMSDAGTVGRSKFIQNGTLNMRLVLEHFVMAYHDIYGEAGEKFTEEEGRKQFLLYLRPIINGVGHYYIEAETRDRTRTDVVVDYLGKQYVIELKIWRGQRYHAEGKKQLLAYLDYYHLKEGYLVSFNFNQKKVSGVQDVPIGDRVIIEAIV